MIGPSARKLPIYCFAVPTNIMHKIAVCSWTAFKMTDKSKMLYKILWQEWKIQPDRLHLKKWSF